MGGSRPRSLRFQKYSFSTASSPTPPLQAASTDTESTGDTVTSPTASMLAATQSCTLLDDVFAEDPTTIALEKYMADLTGKEAALFVTSGTMGNQLSIKTALGGPPHSVLADSRSHVIEWSAYPSPFPHISH